MLIDQLKSEEGLRLKVYRCTAGHNTIGYGHNIDAKPTYNNKPIPKVITESFAIELLKNDIAETTNLLEKKWKGFEQLDNVRRDALINITFQLGINGVMKFENMHNALISKDWQTAYNQAIDSGWGKQTPGRARRVAGQFLTGEYYG